MNSLQHQFSIICAIHRYMCKRWESFSIRRPLDSRDPACVSKPLLSFLLLKCLLLCHLNLSSGGVRGGVGTAQSTYAPLPPPGSARPSGRAQTPPQASHGPLWSALARYETTFRESLSKMVASGPSSQAPEGLSLQRELDFHSQQGSHIGAHFG